MSAEQEWISILCDYLCDSLIIALNCFMCTEAVNEMWGGFAGPVSCLHKVL